MATTENERWIREFKLIAVEELDFVLGALDGWPVGMMAESPPEFRRNILAAIIANRLQLQSIDYARKRYVQPSTYENEHKNLGDLASNFLRDATKLLKVGLKDLHTQRGLTLGKFGAELTIFKIPDLLESARMLSNRGLLLETAPLLRLALEMLAWATTVFPITDDKKVSTVKAHACISCLKPLYGSAGSFYGYLSKFTHWELIVHSTFLKQDAGGASVIKASVYHSSIALVLCLILLDIVIEVVRDTYPKKSRKLIAKLQGTASRSKMRKSHQIIQAIVDFADDELFQRLNLMLR